MNELHRTLFALGLDNLKDKEPHVIKEGIIQAFKDACLDPHGADFLTISFLLKEGFVPFPKEELLDVYELIEAATSSQRMDIISHIANRETQLEPLLYHTIFAGIKNNNNQMVYFAVRKGFDINKHSTALIDACCAYYGNIQIFNHLLRHGLDLKKIEESSFYRAVRHGYLEIVKVMLPNLKKIRMDDWTVFQAIERNETSTNEAVQYLIEDYRHQPFFKKLLSPKRIFNKILKLGASTIENKAFSSFPLYEQFLRVSAEHNNFQMIDYLINIGANKKVVDMYGTEESKQYVGKISLKDSLEEQLNPKDVIIHKENIIIKKTKI